MHLAKSTVQEGHFTLSQARISNEATAARNDSCTLGPRFPSATNHSWSLSHTGVEEMSRGFDRGRKQGVHKTKE